MTIFNCSVKLSAGTAVPFASGRRALPDAAAGEDGLVRVRRWSTGSLHVSIASEFFKGVLAFFILSPAGALRSFGLAQFLNDLAHRFRIRFNWKSAGRTAQAPIAFAFAIAKIEGTYRNAMQLHSSP